MESLDLTDAQRFEIEKFNRVIDATSDLDDLRKLAKIVFKAWMTQRAATAWVMRQNLPESTNFRSTQKPK